MASFKPEEPSQFSKTTGTTARSRHDDGLNVSGCGLSRKNDASQSSETNGASYPRRHEQDDGRHRRRVQVELAINYNNENDLTMIRKALDGKVARMTSANIAEKTVQIELKLDEFNLDGSSTSDVSSLQRSIEQQTGFATVIKGVGQLASAVAELRAPPIYSKLDQWRQRVYGVVRLSQLAGDSCYVDGIIDGLNNQREYSLAVHEFGDLSDGSLQSIGSAFVKISDVRLQDGGKVSIHKIIHNCHVPSMIGRSIALSFLRPEEQLATNELVCAGIVARASTVEANKKQVCACSGKTLWEERRDKRKDELS